LSKISLKNISLFCDIQYYQIYIILIQKVNKIGNCVKLLLYNVGFLKFYSVERKRKREKERERERERKRKERERV